jgi:ABC-type Fe3+-hydroxamate transport system substrate-binding protein
LKQETLLTLGLLVVFVLSACTPTASVPSPVAPTLEPQPAAPEPVTAPNEATAIVPVAPEATETEPPAEGAAVVPTSRGNELEATDPATVSLATGKPQLIEFFAFW